MATKKNRIYHNVTITDLGEKGRGIGRTPEGKVIFVEGAIPGDKVDVLYRGRKKKVTIGSIHKYLEQSEHSSKPICSHFGICGGCKIQNMKYDSQILFKEKIVHQTFTRIGKIQPLDWLPILAAPSSEYYRNKMVFTYSNKRWLEPSELNTEISNVQDVLGFHRPMAFDKIVDIQKCFLQFEPSNKIRNVARQIGISQGLSFYDIRAQQGFLRNLVVRTYSTGEIMVIIAFGKSDPPLQNAYLKALIEAVPEITSLQYCVNTKPNDFLLDLEMKVHSGPDYVTEKIGDLQFKIGPKSFFQTNSNQVFNLYQVIADFADLNGSEIVYDLYTGIGSIALFVANKCKSVVGIEEVEMAIADAKVNAEINKINNAIFYSGDVKSLLNKEFSKKHGKPDLLITDPPRAGMHPKVVDMLLELEPSKIVYVSCNPATQARDINLLAQKYSLIKARPVDMFPHTNHIENVALLNLIG